MPDESGSEKSQSYANQNPSDRSQSVETHYVEPPNTDSSDTPPVIDGEVRHRSNHKNERDRQEPISEEAFIDRIRKSDRWIIFLTAVIAIGGLVSSAIFWKQLSIMSGQLDVMRAEQRPWVSAIPSINHPFVYTPDEEASITIRYDLQNSGHSPATNVWVEQRFFPMMPADVRKQIEEVCTQDEKVAPRSPFDRILGFPVFPNDVNSVEWESIIQKDEIEKFNANFKRKVNAWSPVLLACIFYRSPIDFSIHHTPLLLNLMMKRSAVKEGRGCCGIFLSDSPIPAEKLEIRRGLLNRPAD
jgi:hypothetical protein